MRNPWKRTRAVSMSLGVVLLLALVGNAGEAAPAGATASAERPVPKQCVPSESCCKVCRKGRACGNTCIRADYNYHKGRGCACDAEEICE